jgi:hypothetical protein
LTDHTPRGPDTLKFQSPADWRASQFLEFRLTFSDCSDDIGAFRNICSFTMGIYDPHFQHHRASNLSL